jgi:phage-related tail protein
MRSSPANSALNEVMSSPPSGTDAFHPRSETGGSEDAVVESANAEIQEVASAIEELQGRLKRANAQIGQVQAVRTTELEIGKLFMEAQRFTDAALSNLETQIQAILIEAESKASEIVSEAESEAKQIRHEAQVTSSLSATTAKELQTAIAGFSSVNGELVKELSALNSMLDSSTSKAPEFREITSEATEPS